MRTKQAQLLGQRFDASPGCRVTDVGRRSHERLRRALLSALTMAFVRGSNLFSTLIVVPIALHYLGSERFGVFTTVVAITAMIGFADLGLGNGLINAVAGASGRDDASAIRMYVSTAVVLLSGLSAAIAVFFFLIYRHVDWAV